jgi:hypothetical protein
MPNFYSCSQWTAARETQAPGLAWNESVGGGLFQQLLKLVLVVGVIPFRHGVEQIVPLFNLGIAQ